MNPGDAAPAIEVEVNADGWAELRFSRPDQHNAMTAAMWIALHDEVKILAGEEIRALVVTGSGTSFVAGSDLGDVAGRSVRDALDARAQRAIVALNAAPFATIAAINGRAVGGGLEIALACDLRIAADTAVLAAPELGFGMVPAAGATARLAALVGHGRAAKMVLTGRSVGADEAQRIGLVDEVVPVEDVVEEARGTARSLADRDPIALKMALTLLRARAGYDDDALERERLAQAVCFGTGRPQAAARAFLDRRDTDNKGSDR